MLAGALAETMTLFNEKKVAWCSSTNGRRLMEQRVVGQTVVRRAGGVFRALMYASINRTEWYRSQVEEIRVVKYT